MRSAVRPLVVLSVVVALGTALGACSAAGKPSATASAGAPADRSAAASTPAQTSAASSQTPPAGSAAASAAASKPVGVTKTSWGRILDAVPAGFPVFPDATLADPPPSGPVSGAWLAKASVSEVAGWYHDALVAAHFAKVDLGSPLEDGSQVLDVQGDLPECKVQVTVKPLGGSTMIAVLYGAGCAARDG